ncbi:DUF6083 domain-containing protein [Streptomyces sp. NPDC002513]
MREPGHIPMMTMLCDHCWNVEANKIAIGGGATDSPAPEPDPDDVTWFAEPIPPCEKCGEVIQRRRTNYGRWVHLELEQMTAKEVPHEYRWRLMPLRARHSLVPVEIIAVKVGAMDPRPGDPVYAAHAMFCSAPEATANEKPQDGS